MFLNYVAVWPNKQFYLRWSETIEGKVDKHIISLSISHMI